MKGFLNKLATQTAFTTVMLLMVFAPFASLTAQAQNCLPDGSNAATCQSGGAASAAPAAQATNPVTNTSGNINTGTPSTIGTTVASGDNSGTGSGTNPTSNLFGSCTPLPGFGFSASNCIRDVIYAFTIGLASIFAYVAAYFFDITIQLSLNGASYGLNFISTSWTTARDLGNMAFLFILLYIAFTIIFRADTNGTRSMLAIVILVALLVNFSFFFTRVVIDAGNILSIQFYNAIPAQPISQTIQGSPSGVASYVSSIGNAAGGTKDLTASIMGMLNVQGLLNNNSFALTNGNFIATIFIYIAGAIVLWLLAIAFITNGIKFLVRVVVLWFLIIASPLALISLAVPGSGGYFTKWREALVQHAFYPVAFMFVFLVLNNFAATMANNNTLTGGVFTTTQNSGGSGIGAIGASLVALAIRLALVIAVLYIGMKASDSISVTGSKAAGNIGGWFGGKFLGTYGALGRNTLGLGAYRLSQNAAANNAFVRTLWRGTNTVAKSSFDARGALKAAGVKDIAGASLGDAQKGGYKGSLDARVKMREEEAKKFKDLTDAEKEANKKAQEEVKAQNAQARTDEAKRVENEVDKKFGTDRSKVKTDLEDAEKAHAQATKEEKDAAEKVTLALRNVDDLVKKNKQGTPEMDAALKARDDAEAEKKSRNAASKTAENHIAELTKKQKELNDTVNKFATEITRDIPQMELPKLQTRKAAYADSLEHKGPLGRLGNMSRAGFWIPAGDKAAATKLRKEKSKDQKLIDAVKDLQKEDEPAAEKKEDKKDDHH